MELYFILAIGIILFSIILIIKSLNEQSWKKRIINKQQTFQMNPQLKQERTYYKQGVILITSLSCLCLFGFYLNQSKVEELKGAQPMSAKGRSVDVEAIHLEYINQLWKDYLCMDVLGEGIFAEKQIQKENNAGPILIQQVDTVKGELQEVVEMIGSDGVKVSMAIYQLDNHTYIQVPSVNEFFYLVENIK